jgi:hypothetical protein
MDTNIHEINGNMKWFKVSAKRWVEINFEDAVCKVKLWFPVWFHGNGRKLSWWRSGSDRSFRTCLKHFRYVMCKKQSWASEKEEEEKRDLLREDRVSLARIVYDSYRRAGTSQLDSRRSDGCTSLERAGNNWSHARLGCRGVQKSAGSRGKQGVSTGNVPGGGRGGIYMYTCVRACILHHNLGCLHPVADPLSIE